MSVHSLVSFALRGALEIDRFRSALLVLAMLASGQASAAIVWDGEGNSPWWFDPVNWNAATNSNAVLPPANNAAGTQASDTQINIGSGDWNTGEGVIYDPANDPFFDDAELIPFPPNFNRQTIRELYLSRGTEQSTLLTIKGDLTSRSFVHVGSASGVRGAATNATIVQESGNVQLPLGELVVATVATNAPASVGRGNGTYDYRGGTLEVSEVSGGGLILSAGSNSNASDGQKAGPGGIGKFIMHNPGTAGYVRVYTLTTAAFAGFDEGIQSNPNDSVFNPVFDADGEVTGVGIFEFHYAHGGTRPIQVNTDLILNNGLDNNTKGTRSSRLNLILDEPACEGAGCIPGKLGLFDVGFDGTGSLAGSGDLDGDNNFTNDRVFSSIDNSTDYREGDIVSAVFGSTRYDWMITYTGDINWSNANNSEISSITGAGTGNDIVLIGVGSSTGTPGDFDGDGDVDGRDFLAWQRGQSPDPLSAGDLADWQSHYGVGTLASVNSVPEPVGLMLLCAALPLFGRVR